VREFYILHHEPRWQLFYRRDAAGRYQCIPTPEGILRSSVLPGFQFRLADLARQPEPEEMIEDPVYAGFVLPRWQADRAAWDLDRQALTAERQAREQAEQVAEREREAKEALQAELARLRGVS
jgi:hypothetical protein